MNNTKQHFFAMAILILDLETKLTVRLLYINPLARPQQTKVNALESQEKIDHKAEDMVQYTNTLKSSHVAAWKELWGLDKPHQAQQAEETA